MRRNRGFVLFTVLLVLVTGCSAGSVAMCQAKGTVRVNEQYYIGMEQAYVEEVRQLLSEAGLTDAGVMLTHVREEDGTRIYKLSVHHRNYPCLNREERESLSDAVHACSFETDKCIFVQEFH